jgi:hypothetical protein
LAFAMPLVLLSLLPLAGLAGWLLIGRPAAVRVPFVALWPRDRRGPTARARRRLPPLPILLLWLAAVLGVLALARPTIHGSAAGRSLPISVVVDRGASMRASDRDAVQLLALRDALLADDADPVASFNLVVAREPARPIDLSDLSADTLRDAPATSSRESASLLRARVRERLAAGDELVIVLTDQTLEGFDPSRVLAVAPPTPIGNAGIARVSVANGEAMVEVAGDVPDDAVPLVVRVGGLEQRASVSRASPAAFVALPGESADAIEVRLEIADAVDADDVAFVARRSRPARVVQVGAVSPMLRRWIEAYTSSRPAADASAGVVAVSESADAIPRGPSLVVVPRERPTDADARTQAAHPLLDALDLADVPLAEIDVPAGEWVVLARDRDARPVLAVREQQGTRSVRMGLQVEQASRSPAAIALLASAADWIGGVASAWEAVPIASLPADAAAIDPTRAGEAGLYRLASGEVVAAMAPVAASRVGVAEELATASARWQAVATRSRSVPLAPALLLLSALVAAAALARAALPVGRS